MQIDEWASTPELNDIYRDVVKHDLTQNVAELDAFGFTVVPPEKVAPDEFQQQMRDALLGAHERRTGQKVSDIEHGRTGLMAIENPYPFAGLELPPAERVQRFIRCGNNPWE